MNKSTKILIQGGYGFHNWGDDAQLYNNVRILKEKEFTDLTIMSPTSYIKDLCNCSIVPSSHSIFTKSMKCQNNLISRTISNLNHLSKGKITKKTPKSYIQLIKNIDNCNVFFFSGSGTVNTRHWYGLGIFLTPLIIAHNLGKTIILSGQGFTPIEKGEMQELITSTLNKTNKIFTRDFQLGYETLKKIGVDLTKVELGIDDAFTTPKKEIILPKNSVALNVSCFIPSPVIERFYDLAVLLKKNGFNPIFNYFQSDKNIAEKCSKGKFPIMTFTSPEEIAGFYASCISSLGMRYHSTIFSLAGETPTINLFGNEYQEDKIKAIREEERIPYLGMTFKKTSTESMYEKLMLAMETQPIKLKELNIKWRPKGNLAINYLETL